MLLLLLLAGMPSVLPHLPEAICAVEEYLSTTVLQGVRKSLGQI